MPTKEKAQSYLRKQLGKKSADTILKKLEQLAKKGASASELEKLLVKEIEAHVQAKIIPALNRGIRSGVKDAVAAVRKPIINSGQIINSGNIRIINSGNKPSPGPGPPVHSKPWQTT
jgi:hypothetical protein